MTYTKPKPFVFVLMPFLDEFDDIYQLGIKPACSDAGAYCERVDEQIFHESILERIYNQIAKADVIVADMTGRNANVFYETGYAHALGKKVILLTQNGDDIPFDLKHYPHIVYAGKITHLKSELENRVRWHIEHPDVSPTRLEFDLEIFISSKPVPSRPEISASWILLDEQRDYGITIQFDINNPSATIYDGICTLGLITPKRFDINYSGAKVVQLPNERCLHLLSRIPSILPNGWDSAAVVLSCSYGRRPHNQAIEIILVIYTEIGTKEYPIILKVD
jgi:hypothetical protein